MTKIKLLPGVPEQYVRDRLEKSKGNEIESGKFNSPDSSAALAANCFGWFHERPASLPGFPKLDLGFPALTVDIECEARFPWAGGTHPWLDAAAVTATHLIGIESKRFEPFRDVKQIDFSDAYDRDHWGPSMKAYERMRDSLKRLELQFRFLDAAQLVKHALGLVTQGRRRSLRTVLTYIYAEPAELNGRPIPVAAIEGHRAEIQDFAMAVAGSEVLFNPLCYRDWIQSWRIDTGVAEHGRAVLETFAP
jgi:hypothetical protein